MMKEQEKIFVEETIKNLNRSLPENNKLNVLEEEIFKFGFHTGLLFFDIKRKTEILKEIKKIN